MSYYPTKFSTTWVIAAIAAVLAAWDLWAKKVREATISEVLLSSATHSPLIPFLFGVLMGHLFWPQVAQ